MFKFTIFRNPVERVISYYKKLQDIKKTATDKYYIKKGNSLIYRRMFNKDELNLLGTFDEFLENIPKYRLLKQLYTFSKNYDVNEAVANVKKLNHFMFMEDWDNGLASLNSKLGFELKNIRDNVGITEVDVPRTTRVKLIKMLKDEYLLYSKLWNTT